MDGEGDAGGGCSGEIGEVRVDSWIAGAALVAHGRRKGGPGGRDASLVLLEAPCVSANLLPVTSTALCKYQ